MATQNDIILTGSIKDSAGNYLKPLSAIKFQQDRIDQIDFLIGRYGPRYCPSIEDKVVRFSDKSAHQIFLEPEGRHTLEFYCNGISTSLPRDVQDEMIRSIAGLEHAEIMRYGYAVEYDIADPSQVFP